MAINTNTSGAAVNNVGTQITNFIPSVWSKKILDKLKLECKLVDNCWQEYEGDVKQAAAVHILGIGTVTVKDYGSEPITYDKIEDVPYDLSEDKDYSGAIILLDNLNEIKIDNDKVEAESGIILTKFINTLINNNLGGLENLYGLPGTLGGAIHGNAGCYGGIISDYLVSVTYLENDCIKTLNKENCEFLYRDSIFKHDKNKIILSAKFELIKKDKTIMQDTVKTNLIKRKNTQPIECYSAGSVFRNPTNLSAGKLIEESGLKGKNINDAEISSKHANFIINKGNASSEDIKELINLTKETIKDKYNIDLVLEQEIIKY